MAGLTWRTSFFGTRLLSLPGIHGIPLDNSHSIRRVCIVSEWSGGQIVRHGHGHRNIYDR